MRAERDFSDHWWLFTYYIKQASPARPLFRSTTFRAYTYELARRKFDSVKPDGIFQLMCTDWHDTEPIIGPNYVPLNSPRLSESHQTYNPLHMRSPRVNASKTSP